MVKPSRPHLFSWTPFFSIFFFLIEHCAQYIIKNELQRDKDEMIGDIHKTELLVFYPLYKGSESAEERRIALYKNDQQQQLW